MAIKAVVVETDHAAKIAVESERRNCLFHDEIQLNLHVNYTQANCRLECAIEFAQKTIGINCTPWYLPTVDKPVRMCDPWEAVEFDRLMFHEIPDGKCKHCLPDCTTADYSTSISLVPFRRCDYKNLGVSSLCNLNDPRVPEPRIWGDQVIQEFKESGKGPVPAFITSQVCLQTVLKSAPKFKLFSGTIKYSAISTCSKSL